MKHLLSVFSLILLTCLPVQASGDILLVPDHILDVKEGVLLEKQAVVLRGQRILRIGDTSELQGGQYDRIIRLPGKTLMPGLIDAHSHILLHPYNETGWNDQVLKESFAERTLRAGNHMRATLKAGFTSLRDLGSEGAGYLDVGIKQAMHKGVIEGPRILVAGRAIVATGSYGPKGFDLSHQISLGAEPADGDGLVRVVRDQIGKGADIIKFYADYRWGPDGKARPTFSLEEMKLMVRTANDSGRQVVAHAATAEGMRRATLAGVQSIEHGDGGTPEVFKLMKEKGVIYCPTIAAGDAISQYRGWNKGQDPEPARVVKKRQTMKHAIAAGVTICNGSDVGVFTHGDNARELGLLVEYGVTIPDALRAATITGAVLMGQQGQLGQVKEGYLADIIAVGGNPLQSLNVLGDVSFVMKDGAIYLD